MNAGASWLGHWHVLVAPGFLCEFGARFASFAVQGFNRSIRKKSKAAK
jgi:hypothetical protein